MKPTIFSKKPKRERISHSQKGYQNLKSKVRNMACTL